MSIIQAYIMLNCADLKVCLPGGAPCRPISLHSRYCVSLNKILLVPGCCVIMLACTTQLNGLIIIIYYKSYHDLYM